MAPALFERLKTTPDPGGEHHRLSSAPPSPQGVDLAIPLYDVDEEQRHEPEPEPERKRKKKKKKGKGGSKGSKASVDLKGKGREVVDDAEEEQLEAVARERESRDSYPPVNDEEAEARKIQETLAHWDMMEKQRRKAARESRAARTPSTIIQDFAGYVTSFGASSNAKPPPGAVKLKEEEADVDLELGTATTTKANDGDGAAKNPFTSPNDHEEDITETANKRASGHAKEATTSSDQDPFRNPPPPGQSTSISAAGGHQREESQSSKPLLPQQRSSSSSTLLQVPTIPRRRRSSSRSRSPSPTNAQAQKHKRKTTLPARPLDLPEPKMVVPADAAGLGHWRRAQEARQRELDLDDELEEDRVRGGRWWTDLFCGCRESHRREDQDGRTNPFE